MLARAPTERDEQGVVAIEFMLVISMLIVVFLLMLQYAVRAHAERIVAAAADEALAATTAYDGSAPAGRRVAEEYLHEVGPGLQAAHVVTRRDATTGSVTISGTVQQLVPFLPVSVEVTVTGPVERFVSQAGDPTP